MPFVPPPLPPIAFPPAATLFVDPASTASRQNIAWNRPLFKAPALPLPSLTWSEIPFSAHIVRPKALSSGKAA